MRSHTHACAKYKMGPFFSMHVSVAEGFLQNKAPPNWTARCGSFCPNKLENGQRQHFFRLSCWRCLVYTWASSCVEKDPAVGLFVFAAFNMCSRVSFPNKIQNADGSNVMRFTEQEFSDSSSRGFTFCCSFGNELGKEKNLRFHSASNKHAPMESVLTKLWNRTFQSMIFVYDCALTQQTLLLLSKF